jgi:hypothetical protein
VAHDEAALAAQREADPALDHDDPVEEVFQDQVACAENLSGLREIPDHPLVRQTLSDCLNETMDIAGFEQARQGFDLGVETRCIRAGAAGARTGLFDAGGGFAALGFGFLYAFARHFDIAFGGEQMVFAARERRRIDGARHDVVDLTIDVGRIGAKAFDTRAQLALSKQEHARALKVLPREVPWAKNQ